MIFFIPLIELQVAKRPIRLTMLYGWTEGRSTPPKIKKWIDMLAIPSDNTFQSTEASYSSERE